MKHRSCRHQPGRLGGFARQQWRAWIETSSLCKRRRIIADSPASNGGRGLKLPDTVNGTWLAMDSPASNGGRGLKQPCTHPQICCEKDSPASNGGRGLKLACGATGATGQAGFARQQWRAWIETSPSSQFGSRSDRFARQQWRAWIETTRYGERHLAGNDSPASNGGRGL